MAFPDKTGRLLTNRAQHFQSYHYEEVATHVSVLVSSRSPRTLSKVELHYAANIIPALNGMQSPKQSPLHKTTTKVRQSH